MTQKIDTLTAEIGLVVTSILNTDLALLRDYSHAKARAISSYTLLLANGFATGSISSEQMTEEMAELERMVARFVRNIKALAITTIERLLSGIGESLMAILTRAAGLGALTLVPPTGVIWGVSAA